MKTLLFGPGLLEPTLQGLKQITIRKYRSEAHDFESGEFFIGEFADGLNLVLLCTATTRVTLMQTIPEEDAVADGYNDRAHLFEEMKTYYPDLDVADPAGIIRFQIPEIDGVPTVVRKEEA